MAGNEERATATRPGPLGGAGGWRQCAAGGRRVGLREHDVDRAVGWFERYGPVAVSWAAWCRWSERSYRSRPGSRARPGPGRGFHAAGRIPGTTGLAIAGYAVGRNWQAVANGFHGPTYVIAAVLVIALIVAIWRRRAHRSAIRAPQEDAEMAPSQTERQSTRDWPGADSQRRALGQAVSAAEFAVLEAQQAGAPTGELDELCQRLRLAARDAASSPLPAQSSPVAGPTGRAAAWCDRRPDGRSRDDRGRGGLRRGAGTGPARRRQDGRRPPPSSRGHRRPASQRRAGRRPHIGPVSLDASKELA